MLPLAESETGQPPVRRGKGKFVLGVTREPEKQRSNGNAARLIKIWLWEKKQCGGRDNTSTAAGVARQLHSMVPMQVSLYIYVYIY